jgi:hypothetical protein
MRLNSKVHVFGFELSPRKTGKFEMIVQYWDSQMNTRVGITITLLMEKKLFCFP